MRNFAIVLRTWQLSALVGMLVLAAGAARAKEAPAVGEGPANVASRRVWEEARRILERIQSTEYQHRTEIDEQKGDYRCDCSGLGIYVLNRTVAKDDPQGPLGDGRTRPRAMHFYEAFVDAKTQADGGRWRRVERVVDARPGDIIAWRRDVIRPGNSGHVVIVDERPLVEEDGLVRVVMIDSTTRPQVDDTRGEGESGVGRGTMWFQVDEAGRPVAYVRGSREAEPTAVRISIGRAMAVEESEQEGQARKAG